MEATAFRDRVLFVSGLVVALGGMFIDLVVLAAVSRPCPVSPGAGYHM